MENIKRIRKVFIFIMIILVFIAILFVIVTDNIRRKVNKIQFNSDFDKNQLAINEELYNQVADNVTQQEFNSIQNIAILGIDEGRCELVIIVSVNQSKDKIKIITIPRETYANIMTDEKIKIEQLALKTINSSFGLNITKYISIDYKGIMKFIDRIGGITLNISNESGLVNLTGEQVLSFMRNTNNNENSEIENCQKRVLEGILNKIEKKRHKEIWDSIDFILEEVQTNLNKSQDMGIGRDIMNNAQSYIEKVELTQATSEDSIKDIIYGKD